MLWLVAFLVEFSGIFLLFSDSLVILKVFIQRGEATFLLRGRLLSLQWILDLFKSLLGKFQVIIYMCRFQALYPVVVGEVGWHAATCSDFASLFSLKLDIESPGFLFFEEFSKLRRSKDSNYQKTDGGILRHIPLSYLFSAVLSLDSRNHLLWKIKAILWS